MGPLLREPVLAAVARAPLYRAEPDADRLAAALEGPARGETPSVVATRVGYATASAFGAMVRAEPGTTPGAPAGY